MTAGARMRGALAATAAALAAGWVGSAPAWAQGGYGPGMMWDYGWGHMIFGGLMMVVFWGGLIAAIVLAVRWLTAGRSGQGGSGPPPRPTPLDILKERYARGEIDREEYEERRRVLGE